MQKCESCKREMYLYSTTGGCGLPVGVGRIDVYGCWFCKKTYSVPISLPTMLAPDKGQAADAKDESGSAPCG